LFGGGLGRRRGKGGDGAGGGEGIRFFAPPSPGGGDERSVVGRLPKQEVKTLHEKKFRNGRSVKLLVHRFKSDLFKTYSSLI
jgi:hypothetical protein